mmetsp:Transcript_3755/g.9268  ORF Transcript_3755/g.9268 Transcript_3755/m.9268 type:complete len:182 (-) Transcript_3755:145-690(-)
MGINREGHNKRKKTGGLKISVRKKRNHSKGRQPAQTKIGTRYVKKVRVRGGNIKNRALFLNYGNFSLISLKQTFKAKIISVAFNESSNELVRTNTLTKGSIVYLDIAESKLTTKIEKFLKSNMDIHANFELSSQIRLFLDQITSGKILARICSRPGQSGRADGYILEGQELEYFVKKIQKK